MRSGLPVGEALSLLTALTWAWAVVLFKKSGERVHPLALTLFKNTLGILLFGLTIAVAGPLRPQLTALDLALCAGSGVLGIGVADTLFFASLNRLGASLAALVSCLYSPLVVGLATWLLGERLSLLQLVGLVAIVAGVVLGTLQRGSGRMHHVGTGVCMGVVAQVCTAVGVVVVKPLLSSLPFLWVTELRLVGGQVALVLAMRLHPARSALLASLRGGAHMAPVVASSILGGYVAMMLWLAGMKLTAASVASALNETSTLFVLLLSALFLGEALTLRKTLAVGLGVCGAVLVTWAA